MKTSAQHIREYHTLKLAAFLVLDLMAMNLTAIAAHAATPTIPTFYARRDYQETPATQILVADTNQDGIPDIVINNHSLIEVMLGNGDGTFRPGPSSATILAGSEGFALADVNGDGIIDAVVSGALRSSTGGIAVSLGNDDGTFQQGTFYSTGPASTVVGPVIGDFNGDGILDVIVVSDTSVWLFTGQGGGTFNSGTVIATLTTGGPLAIVTADLNGDRKLDLVITLHGQGFVILFGNGNGTFQPAVAFSQPASTNLVAVGPLTKGGPPGIVLGGPNDVFLYYGDGTGKFYGPYTVPGSGGGIGIGDVNGDGLPDIVTGGAYILFGTGGGKFSKPVYYPIWGASGPRNAYGLALADLRNNGLTDIVTDGGGVSVLLNKGKGVFEDGIWTKVAGGAGCGVKGDFNGDGKPDLAVNNTNGSSSTGISILLGTGKWATPFTAGTSISLPSAGCLVTGDVNHDGKLDLLVPVNGTVNTYLGNGDGTFTLSSTTPTPSGGFLALGDFNHDGKLDFATSGNLMALGNGDGTFQNPTDIVASPPFGGYDAIAAEDINNDGWTDLVLTSNVFPVDANVTVLLNNHNGGFTQEPTTFGALATQPILSDLNGDGNLDLVVLGVASGAAAVALGDGKGGFTLSPTLLLGPLIDTPGLVRVADVNGDGVPDILLSGGDTLFIYLGEPGATYATPVVLVLALPPAPYSWRIFMAKLSMAYRTSSFPISLVA
jgi:hypothetical protein